MATANISITVDTFIDNVSTTTNFDGNDNLDVGEQAGGALVRRSLLKPDFSSIPAGMIFDSATLKIWDRGTNLSSNNRTMKVYRLLRSWTVNQATWNKADSGTNWGTAGASNTSSDREATDIGSISMPATEVAGENDITLTASKVQEMYDGTITNNGFLLQMDTETDDMHRFNASEWSTSSERPVLSIEYHSPDSGGFYYMSS